MLLCNKRPLLWRKGEVVWRRQLHVVCNLGPEVKPDRPLSSGRLPQGGIVAAEGKKKASLLAPRRKSVPEGRGMQGGALRAFATPSEAPPCGFQAKPQGEKEKRQSFSSAFISQGFSVQMQGGRKKKLFSMGCLSAGETGFYGGSISELRRPKLPP